MNYLLFHLKRLLMFPAHFFGSSIETIGSTWSASDRSRALILGLPSILIAVIGVLVLSWAKFGIADSLEDRYLVRLEDSNEQKSQLLVQLRLELKMLRAAQNATANTPAEELLPADDPRRVELEALRSEQKVYLEKLMDLDPDEPEYLYRLALLAYERMDINRCLALMNLTAPLDEPGYIRAHLWLAGFYMRARVKTQKDAMRNLDLALEHAEQCLKRDQGNVRAKQIKATLLFAQKRDLDVAYEIFQELFQKEPRHYRPLVDINKQMNMSDRDDAVLDSAIERFEEQLNDETLETAEKIQIHRELTGCYLLKKQYAIAEQRLLEELQSHSASEQELSRVWVERELSAVYVAWSGSIDPSDPNAEKMQLDLMKKAYQLNPRNSAVMRQLTRMGDSADPEVASEATSIYNGLLDPNAPASVLNEIGAQALSRSDYAAALRYFEMARQKSPKNPEILNNLAYAHIVGENPNPKRGLTLVTQALRFLPNTMESRRYLTFFRDTRGQALMQLNKWTEAAADFEFALVDRPKNKKILEALIQCYRANGLDPSPYVERLRAVIEEESGNNPDQGGPISGQ